MATVVVGVAYAVYLVPDDAGVRPWVVATSALLTAAAVACLALSLRRVRRHVRYHETRRPGLVLAALALLLGAAWASATAVADHLGPFDAPYQPAALTVAGQSSWQRDVATWPALAAYAALFPATQSVDSEETSAEVSVAVLASGREFLPVGGFSGRVPSTPLADFVAGVRSGRIARALVEVRPLTRNPDMSWVLFHCQPGDGARGFVRADARVYRRYLCSPADTGD